MYQRTAIKCRPIMFFQTNFTKKYSGLLEFWFLVRPTLCGEQSEVADSLKQDRENITEKLNRGIPFINGREICKTLIK